MRALERANQVRLERAEIKRAVGRGDQSVADLILSPPWCLDSCTIIELLTSQRRWGRTRARKLLADRGVYENREIGKLTHRQRKLLAADLKEKANGD